jgi:hypothetical protein
MISAKLAETENGLLWAVWPVLKAEEQIEGICVRHKPDRASTWFRDMRITKKTHLIWSEPDFLRKDFRKRVLLKERLKNYFSQVAKVFVIAAAILMVVSLFRGQSLGEILVANFFFLSLIVSLFLCSGSWLYQYLPSLIYVQDDGIGRLIGQKSQYLSYKEIQHCSIKNLRVETEEVKVLEIMTIDGRSGYVEIAPTVSEEKLVDVLSRAGLEVSRKEFEA